MISARLARGSWRRNPCSWWSATGRPSASTTGIAAIRRPRMRSSASTLDCPESTATKRSFATGASGSSRPRPARMARRRSPSVAIATRRPASSTTSTIPPAPRSTASSPSRIVASFRTMQRASSSVTRRIWGGPGRRAPSRRPATSATTTAPIATVARDPMPMWSRTAAPSPIVVSSPIAVPPPTTTPGARWLNAPTRTSCSTITPELTIACDPTTAPAFTIEPASTTAAGLDAGAGRDPGGGVDDDGPAGVGAHRRDDPAPRLGRRAEPDHEPRAVAGTGGVEPGSQRRVIGLVDQLDDPPRRRVGAGGLGDDARVLADAQDDQRAGRHAGTRIAGLRGGRGGRHAAMICATRAPARPSGRSRCRGREALPEARRRARGGARRRPRSDRPGRR